MKKQILLIVLLCLFLFVGCNGAAGATKDSTDMGGVKEGDVVSTVDDITDPVAETPSEKAAVPDFTLDSSDGGTVTLSELKGKVVVINLWASWCPPCDAEMPDFEKLYGEIDKEKVELLMINQTTDRETKELADAYVSDKGFTFPYLYDYGEVGFGIFGITSIPTTIVIDAQGNLYDYVVGMTDYKRVATMIEGATTVA